MPVDFATQAGHFNGADLQILGKSLSGDSRSKIVPLQLTTIPTAAGTTPFRLIVPFTGTISSIRVAFKDGLVASDTNFLTMRIVNVTQANAAVIAATDANTTKVTGGTALVADTSRTLVLGAGVTPNKLDILEVQFTGTGTLPNTLTLGSMLFNFLVST